MSKQTVLLLFVLLFQGININAQITLTSNVGNTLVSTDMISCDGYDESWSKIFELSDFGITTNDQFIIESGQVAFSKSFGGARIGMAIYSIDDNFPNSNPILVSSGGYQLLPEINGTPQIIDIKFSNPILVPAGVKRILVTAVKSDDSYNPNSSEVIIAGTGNDTGSSWYEGCRKYYDYTPTKDLDIPVPDANFFINVTGEKFNITDEGATTILSHNYCDNIIETQQYACYGGGLKFARTFVLEDFGVSTNEEFIINRGQVAFSSVGQGTKILFNIYKIDANFPDSLSDDNLIGSSQILDIPYFGNPFMPRIFNIDFETPIVVPADVERILVEVFNLGGSGSSLAFIAGTEQSRELSWIKSEGSGCTPYGEYKSTEEMGSPEINYYIKAIGNSRDIFSPFSMNISNNCSDFYKSFKVTNKNEINSILWNFGDPLSGTENSSSVFNPKHDFSSNGTYTISATITSKNGIVYVIEETFDVLEPPYVYKVDDVYACEDSFGTGISSSFDISNIHNQIVNGRNNILVNYFGENGIELPNPLTNNFSNTVSNRETITVKLSYEDIPCCSSETTFDLIVNPLPNLSNVEDIFECNGINNGFSIFDLTQIQSDLTTNNTQVSFYFQDGQQIANTQLNAVVNKVANQEVITVKVTNTLTNCHNETTFNIGVSALPIANTLVDIMGCDDNSDGISEYFDTSNVVSTVLGNQTGMLVSYFDINGNQLPSPLPNPYTNTIANQETVTVRVTNSLTNCYAETALNFITSTQPLINQPANLYACNTGNGLGYFNTENIENQLIGNQPNLLIYYSDENGKDLQSPLPTTYQNVTAWTQTINVRVENELNSLCYSETSFDLIVNELPQINLESDYFLCDLEPFLNISTDTNFDTWKWIFEDGFVISTGFEANLVDAGKYTLYVTKVENGISCENSFSFNVVRSVLPVISDVIITDISNNNSIEIIAEGDGDFEYTIDGFYYQDEPFFQNLIGGIYNIQVRDKLGCGLDSKEVVLVDYPKFFTPNNDGFNDYWQIQGVEKFPNIATSIFDRYGKLLKKLTINDLGWDGTYNGESMFASDYWFTTDLGNGRTFKGHFSLIR